MSDIQNIEIARYHDKIMKDMHRLMEKYRAIMAWDVPVGNCVNRVQSNG